MSKQLKVILFLFLSFFSFNVVADAASDAMAICESYILAGYYDSPQCIDNAQVIGDYTYIALKYTYNGVPLSRTAHSIPYLTPVFDSPPCTDSVPQDLVKNITNNNDSSGSMVIFIGKEPPLYKSGCEYELADGGNSESCHFYDNDIYCVGSYVQTGKTDQDVPETDQNLLTFVNSHAGLSESPVLDVSSNPDFEECFSPVSGSEVCRPRVEYPIDLDAPESCWLVNDTKTCSYGFEDFIDAGYVSLDHPTLPPKNCVRSLSGKISCIEIDPTQADFRLVDSEGNEILISDKFTEGKITEIVTNSDGSVTTTIEGTSNIVGGIDLKTVKIDYPDGTSEESTTYSGSGSNGSGSASGSGSDSLNLGSIEKNTFDTAQGFKSIEAFLGDKSGQAGLPVAGLGGDADETIKGVINGVFDGAESSLSSFNFGSESFIDLPQYFQFSGGCQGLNLNNAYVNYYFDPCDKLAPMRLFLGWFLSILTVYSILLIFVRSST